MRDYRLYLFNGAGHIVDAVEFVCADDAAAEAESERHFSGPAELWNLARRVRVYDATGPADQRGGGRNAGRASSTQDLAAPTSRGV